MFIMKLTLTQCTVYEGNVLLNFIRLVYLQAFKDKLSNFTNY